MDGVLKFGRECVLRVLMRRRISALTRMAYCELERALELATTLVIDDVNKRGGSAQLNWTLA